MSSQKYPVHINVSINLTSLTEHGSPDAWKPAGFSKHSGVPVSLVEAVVFPGRTGIPAGTSASPDGAGTDGVSGERHIDV